MNKKHHADLSYVMFDLDFDNHNHLEDGGNVHYYRASSSVVEATDDGSASDQYIKRCLTFKKNLKRFTNQAHAAPSLILKKQERYPLSSKYLVSVGVLDPQTSPE